MASIDTLTSIDYMTIGHIPWISGYSEMAASLPTGSLISHNDIAFTLNKQTPSNRPNIFS